jgi:hypothetical protein
LKKSGLIAVLGIAAFFIMVTYAWYIGDYSQSLPLLMSEKQIKGQSLMLTMFVLSFLLKDNLSQALKKGLF